jgi:integrase
MPYKREGTKKWWININGVCTSSGTDDYEAAKALEARLKHQRWLQEKMGVEPPHNWQESVVKFLKEREHKASYGDIKQRLLWWHDHLGNITDITIIKRDMIDSILQKHRPITPVPSSANSTANKYAKVVGSVLRAACREWGWTQSFPKLRTYPEPEHRREFLTVDEWHTLEKELPPHLRDAATFAVATGLRAGKVFGLEWSQIDFRNRSLSVSGNNYKRGNTIPLNRAAMAVIERIHADPVRHLKRVFTFRGKPLNDYGKAWFKAMDRADLGEYKQWKDDEGKKHTEWSGFTWHGLRHTFASWLGQSGASEMVIDQLCGWAEKDTRSIYTHLNVETLRPYCEVVDKLLSTTVSLQSDFAEGRHVA